MHERCLNHYDQSDLPWSNRDLASYRKPNVARSVFELLMTARNLIPQESDRMQPTDGHGRK